jgi:hypothetical protein
MIKLQILSMIIIKGSGINAKSKKWYSKLKLEDLEHPFTHYLTNFFGIKKFENIKKYSMILEIDWERIYWLRNE